MRAPAPRAAVCLCCAPVTSGVAERPFPTAKPQKRPRCNPSAWRRWALGCRVGALADIPRVACGLTSRSVDCAGWIKLFSLRAASAVAQTAGPGRIGPRTRSVLDRQRRFSAPRTGLSCRFRSGWVWIAVTRIMAGSQSVDRSKDGAHHRAGDRHPGELEGDGAGVADDAGHDFDQLQLQASQGPVGHGCWLPLRPDLSFPWRSDPPEGYGYRLGSGSMPVFPPSSCVPPRSWP